MLNDRLASQPNNYVVGGKFSIADLSCFSWVNWAEWAGVETEPFPALHGWLEKVQGREGVKRGSDVPEKFEMKEKMVSTRLFFSCVWLWKAVARPLRSAVLPSASCFSYSLSLGDQRREDSR